MEIKFKKKDLKYISIDELNEIISENKNYREDDMIEYMRLSKKQTGLPVDIFVDSYIAYIRNQHGMLVYMVDGDDPRTDPIIPITATEKPRIDKSYPKNLIKQIKTSSDDMDKVFSFIKLNIKKIRDYGNGRIDALDFCDNLSRINEYRMSKYLLNEMVNIPMEKSGLPVDIWIDDGRSPQHGPRIKFKAVKSQKYSTNYASMSISDDPKVFNMPVNHDISSKDIEILKKFVIEYKDILLKACDNSSGINSRDIIALLSSKKSTVDNRIYTVPKYLYHATPSFNYDSIAKNGLGFSRKDRLYDDESIYGKERRGVYLSTSPYECEDYVASSDRFYDMCIDRGIEDPEIVVFQVKTDGLDYENFHSVDNEGRSYFYRGVIPVTNITVVS